MEFLGRIKNKNIRGSLRIVLIGDKLRENGLKGFGHEEEESRTNTALQMNVTEKHGRE